ncbi:hypothetical protein [Dechloromonas denitrificans]|uniref:hypothetical protein n=1 Tax=Dechloromonas denitrificans TaxID=281362 RepID=UPI001CF8ED14|nr:hypothetical protein [Dechloromonas denitrificans]UCV04388.1 hypothetical protein KI611_03740 [Dechloromonas denitrificans]
MSPDSYRVLLNEDWELEDLYEFPHALSQCYAFIYCLDSELQPRDRERINFALREYPWRGGYSYVNIFTVFKNQIPLLDRPKIKSIQKASPGWLDLFLNINVAYQVATAIAVLSGAALSAANVYKKANKLILEVNAARRKETVERLTSTAGEMKAFNSMCTELAKNLGFKSLKELHEHTGDPEISLKLLMAHYRRMSVIVEYADKGKATLTLPKLP